MRIKMWGVRGSIPSPGPDTVEFGGNTSCYEVRCGDALVILDGGTGLRLLGQELLKEMPLEAWMFFSHVHWDHIQGFPFFTPAFVRGNTFHLRGGVNVSRTLEETLAGQMDYPSFPVHLSEMGATMTFRDLYEGESVTVGPNNEVKVTNARGNHPNGVYAYRIEHEGKSVVYITDSEHYAIVDPKLRRLAQGLHHVLVGEAADAGAELRFRQRRDLVDHHAACLTKAVAGRRRDRQTENRRFRGVGRQRADGHGRCRIEQIILHDHDWTRLAGISGSPGRGPDFPALHSSFHSEMESMNA